MDQVFTRIMESARVLGIGADSPEVTQAKHIAVEALLDGRSQDEAFEFARSILHPALV